MNNEQRHSDSTALGMQPNRNHHLVPNGTHHSLPSSVHSARQRVTVSLPTALIERLRNAVYWTGHRSLVDLVTEAIDDIVGQMEEINGGVFPQRMSPLKPGRRQGNRPSVPSHETTGGVSS